MKVVSLDGLSIVEAEVGDSTTRNSRGSGMKNYVIDLDNNFFLKHMDNNEDSFEESTLLEAVFKINFWFEQGHKITLISSRDLKLKDEIKKWLNDNGFKYHNLIFESENNSKFSFLQKIKEKRKIYKVKLGKVIRRGLTPIE
jgi:hypothetical protein